MKMKTLAKYSLGAALIGVFIGTFFYGAYWVTKNGSYWLWYEDMVKGTVREMVKQEALKGG